jgi:hypothetical protein
MGEVLLQYLKVSMRLKKSCVDCVTLALDSEIATEGGLSTHVKIAPLKENSNWRRYEKGILLLIL